VFHATVPARTGSFPFRPRARHSVETAVAPRQHGIVNSDSRGLLPRPGGMTESGALAEGSRSTFGDLLVMAGHSHASNIKHRKAAVDAKKGAAFSKHSKLIMSAARIGGGDPRFNARLALAIEKARAANMTRDTIERAIKKGTGELGGAKLEEIRYEGYGPGGVALLVDVLTDNRNRTGPEMRTLFETHRGNLGEANSVAWMFETKAVLAIPSASTTEDALMEAVLDLGADDLKSAGEMFEVYAEPAKLALLRQGFTDKGFKVEKAELVPLPKTSTVVGRDDAVTLLQLLDALDEHDDVQSTASNVDIPDDVAKAIEADAD
jgi:YebC/PmpR family DNA-binding regulatory protein